MLQAEAKLPDRKASELRHTSTAPQKRPLQPELQLRKSSPLTYNWMYMDTAAPAATVCGLHIPV